MASTLDDMLTGTATADTHPTPTYCDRCGDGTAGKVRWLLLGGRDLVFCDHHANAYGPKLVASGAIHHRLTD
jgi:hypothetical protein